MNLNIGLSKQYTDSKHIQGVLPLKSHISHWAAFYPSVNYGSEQKCRAQLKEQYFYSDEAGGGGSRLDDWNN